MSASTTGRATPRLLDVGLGAVLVELGDIDEVLALDARVQALVVERVPPWDTVVDVVPGARTLLVTVGTSDGAPPTGALVGIRSALLELATGGTGATMGEPVVTRQDHAAVEIEVVYDGPDLQDVAAATGLAVDEVVAAHQATPWRVAFGGFAPGFAYLVGGDPRLRVPRRARPRPTVPAGSVGLAGEFSGVYPRSSPGGWQLVGRTDAVLWDLERDPPALLAPGTVVRFVAREARGTREDRPTPGATAATVDRHAPDRCPGLEVVDPGPLTLVQDLGRPGLARLGVSGSGALDRAAHRLGNRLVGQPEDRAGLEVLLGGLVVRAVGDLTVALTGAKAPALVDGRPAPHAAPFELRDGSVLRLGALARGLRTHVCVRGGIDVDPVLGSRSTDVLSGVGPLPVGRGDRLPVGPAPATFPTVDAAVVAPAPADDSLRLLPGPRLDWLGDPDALAGPTVVWRVSPDSNRVALRLAGGPLRRAPAVEGVELPTEGLVAGAVQLPPGGEPVLFLRDHPVTGGYPVVAVVHPDDLDAAAFLRPGDEVRLRWVQPSPHRLRQGPAG
ncbi:5-oxoprolinase subunit B/C family protein [Terracoccus luteus]|uniref:KipI family sensor histidine kinase inhibitor n=1 Tax=Terracoccus luteus TaxID=53356 RepID=A0A839Q2K0_9MICO|nr:5-oxoprolinase/urea amidolyase family protein [Terracoccus luteus]MBB2987332.1 KipI family sensor histidine kinase inhibitor [Terracoccus luteus]MCP2172983.1 KipI family sensor histidine kinase inhibitor [Terracoccus luteus]